MEPDSFRHAMARFPAGVVVVSARHEAGFRGLTATSFTAVSLEPPLVLVCLDRLAATRDAVAGSGKFAISLLARSQEFMAERFAGRAPVVDPAWREIPHRLGAGGLPLIDGAAAWLECDLHEIRAAGDHDVVIGLVTGAEVGEADPLLHWDRAFWGLSR